VSEEAFLREIHEVAGHRASAKQLLIIPKVSRAAQKCNKPAAFSGSRLLTADRRLG
jgi:hypothetical protein